MEVSSHKQQFLFAQCCSKSFAAVCVRVECHLHICIVILSSAKDLSARPIGLLAIDEENVCQQNEGYNLKFAEIRVYV